MLDRQQEVWFESAHAQPEKLVRLLLFDQSIQLYDAGNESFMAAYELRNVSLEGMDGGFARLHLLPGGTDRLRISVNHLLWPELYEKVSPAQRAKRRLQRSWKWPVLLFTILAVLAGLYFLLVSLISSIGLGLVSTQKEQELGEMIFQSMVPPNSINNKATHQLEQFAGQLQLSERYDLKFTVINGEEINAFAIPGGRIVVYKGILEAMEEPEELVALLGHEASHVNERHSLRSMLRQLSGSVLLSMVFGDLGSIGAAIAGQADHLRTLSYSRSLEKEADEKGMERMVRNQINPEGMVGLMDRLQQSEKDMALPGFLSTHPLTADRKKTAQEYIARYQGEFETPAPLLASWKALKESISGPNADGDRKSGDEW
ncbi:MAG TPA: M48 family metallopeptidase [Flavihumibacter sp.]|jgi:Zn-dependent protease with chaperone function